MESTDSPFQSTGQQSSALSRWSRALNQRYQLLLDLWTPHVASRWCFSVFILLLFMVRVVVSQGWYIVCYGLSIYYLNLFIGFLSPKIDPAFQADDFDDDDQSGPMLPTSANEEFRPFIRRLPEFKFWLQATRATLFSLFLSMFRVFDLPVFWPILLLYFILLFMMTMRQQIKHMWKYRYVPWSRGKQRYGSNVGGTKDDAARLFGTPT
ncbi:Protein RER1, partial [Fragariocoptes setiger]